MSSSSKLRITLALALSATALLAVVGCAGTPGATEGEDDEEEGDDVSITVGAASTANMWVPTGYNCPTENATRSPIRSTDQRFKSANVWIFGDSITERCTWDYLWRGLVNGGYSPAVYAKSGAYSATMINEPEAITSRTGRNPSVIIWALGANDSKCYVPGAGCSTAIDQDLLRLRRAYPNTRLVLVRAYRGGSPAVTLLTSALNAATRRVQPTSRHDQVYWDAWAHKHPEILKSDKTHPTYQGLPTNGARQLANLVLARMTRASGAAGDYIP